jgi:hypothetical protein
MANDLKRKLETALAVYITSLVKARSPLRSYKIMEGSYADDKELPTVIIECMGSTEVFPTGPKTLKVEVMIATQIDDNASGDLPNNAQRRRVRDSHDNALTQLSDALDGTGAVSAIQAQTNKGAVKRSVIGFHFYDITMTDERHQFIDRTFVDALSFDVICQASDAA